MRLSLSHFHATTVLEKRGGRVYIDTLDSIQGVLQHPYIPLQAELFKLNEKVSGNLKINYR